MSKVHKLKVFDASNETYYKPESPEVSSKTNGKNIPSNADKGTIQFMPKSRLPELLDQARDTGLSYRDIQRRAGGPKVVSLGTLNDLHKGKYQNLSLNKILALARGLGLSPSVVFEAAIGRESKDLKNESMRQLLEDYSQLPARDRDEIKPILEMLRADIQRRLHRDT